MAIDNSVITGYYRYTDIWFEWSSVLPNPEDASPLKAIFAHDSLVDDNHPLHEEGIKGVKLYIGAFNTGHSRLLFSSAQVDYVRYWLHEMGYTKEIIPLPYSECLLTEASDLKSVSPVVYENGGALRGAIKDIEKMNKRLKGSNTLLTSRRLNFECVRNYWAEKKGVWCAIDFEGWEYDHRCITEVGWSVVRWEDGKEVEEHKHLTVREHRGLRNGKYVPDRRDHYNFGQSEEVTLKEFKARIKQLIDRLSSPGPLFIIFHDDTQDIKYLRSIDIPLDGLSYVLTTTSIPASGTYALDTSELFAALEGEGSTSKRSLERMCRHLQIPTENLHNAGNDAHYTLDALKSMASGEPIDTQREKRWPNHTSGVQVEFKPWEEDSDFSDPEADVEAIVGGF